MTPSAKKGNNPTEWQRFLDVLDERLQLGLLNYLTQIASYHFEENILYIEPSDEANKEYLTRSSVAQQLQLLAQDILKVSSVVIKQPE